MRSASSYALILTQAPPNYPVQTTPSLPCLEFGIPNFESRLCRAGPSLSQNWESLAWSPHQGSGLYSYPMAYTFQLHRGIRCTFPIPGFRQSGFWRSCASFSIRYILKGSAYAGGLAGAGSGEHEPRCRGGPCGRPGQSNVCPRTATRAAPTTRKDLL